MAWEERKRFGTLKAYWLTMKRSLLAPQEFARELPAEGGLGAPTAYATLGTAVGFVPVLVLIAGIFAVMFALMPQPPQPPPGAAADMPPGWIWPLIGLFYWVIAVASSLGYLFVWSGVLLLSARMFGAPRGTYEGIFRILAYSAGLNVMMGIPVVSAAIYVYSILHAIFGISQKCGVSNGRAAAIYFVPWGVCICLFVGAYAGIIALAMSAAAGVPQP